MTIRLRIGRTVYILDKMTWFGPKDGITELLNKEAARYLTDGGGRYAPWPDYDHAQKVAGEFNAEIVEIDQPEIEYDPEIVY